MSEEGRERTTGNLLMNISLVQKKLMLSVKW